MYSGYLRNASRQLIYIPIDCVEPETTNKTLTVAFLLRSGIFAGHFSKYIAEDGSASEIEQK